MKIWNIYGVFIISTVLLDLCVGTGYAESARASKNVLQAADAVRMPTMPVVSLNTVGNIATDVISLPNNVIIPPEPDPRPHPDPQPVPECEDGGVKDSAYTVDNCMDDLLHCVNTGPLQGGMNDLFNEDVRNSIMNGMGLCRSQVDKCVMEVRHNCTNVYRVYADVWLDFNSRKIQPEYYNFVLRQTGLTPYQAENTCLLLDRNTYGASFAAVSDSNMVNGEYNRGVGAYNSAEGNTLIKSNPQGVDVNSTGYDANRGHYARWDATKAECLIRVGAYNKDDQITNSWLFGAVGNDDVAEVWKKAGDTFTCNKDLFGFSLLNKTKTAAVVGVAGGAVLGAGIGAIAGHGDRNFDCSKESARKKLITELYANNHIGILNEYMESGDLDLTGKVLTVAQCNEIVSLRSTMAEIQDALKYCETTPEMKAISDASKTLSYSETLTCNDRVIKSIVKNYTHGISDTSLTTEQKANKDLYLKRCMFKPFKHALVNGTGIYCEPAGTECWFAPFAETELRKLMNTLDSLESLQGEKSNYGKSIGIGIAAGAGAGGIATAITAFVERSNISCHVGDGLSTVAFGKSQKIDSLKDFYVKWNLHLPDTVSPTSAVVDCLSWKQACSQFNNNLSECPNVQINYKPIGVNNITLVSSACTVSGSACIENTSVAVSYGACM